MKRSFAGGMWSVLFRSTGDCEVETSPFCGHSQIPFVAPKTARANVYFILTCGSCRFARCSVLLQFQQSEMSLQTSCSTLHSNSPLVGTRFGGTFTTRKDRGTDAWDVASIVVTYSWRFLVSGSLPRLAYLGCWDLTFL